MSDSFDLDPPNTPVLLMATAMFNELFVKQLREQVVRGMLGAIERGTTLGKVRFGLKPVPFIGSDGKPVVRDLGAAVQRPVRAPAIDEVAGRYFDVVSVNYYTYDIDAQFLGNIHRWSGNKPILLSEFHYCTALR